MGNFFSIPSTSNSSHKDSSELRSFQKDKFEGTQDQIKPQRTSKPPPVKKEIPEGVIVNPSTIDDPGDDEICGLFIDGLGFHDTNDNLKVQLSKLNIKFRNCSKKKGDPFARIFFDTNEDRRDAYSKLYNYRKGKHVVFVVPLMKNYQISHNLADKRRLLLTNDLEHADILDKVTPWHNIDYPEQLRQKALKFTNIISPLLPPGSPLIDVIPAPDPLNPRNKIEVTVGRDIHGNIAVGYMLGSQKEDIIAPIDRCLNTPPVAVRLADEFRQFVIDSKLPPYDHCTYKGLWKYLIIRATDFGQTMLSAVTFGSIPPEVLESLRIRFSGLVDSLSVIETKCGEGCGKDFNLIQLSGGKFIQERLRGLMFDISPLSFFQTNTRGAELLFSKIEELCEVDQNTVIVDVCCGTGVIGMSMAKRAKAVVGVDIEEQAILDAKRGAEKNGITNCEFIAAPAEKVMGEILAKYAPTPDTKVVCIVDPPRSGLHKKAAAAIRDCPACKRLVYVSCNSDSLVNDAQKILMNPQLRETEPFRPKIWFGVDMFPNTDRCEVIMLMTRNE